MGADPNPLHDITLAIADCADVQRNSDRPKVRMSAEFLKLKRVVREIR
jgi:hypothetical protein